MPRGIQTHVAFYVKDLDETVRKWKKLLAIIDPAMVEYEPAYQTAGEGENLTRVATFINPNGLELQFVSPKKFADDPNAQDRVDHIHFATPDLDEKFEAVRKAGFKIHALALDDPEPTDKLTHSAGLIDMYNTKGEKKPMNWQRWFLVPMPGNVCAEVALPYNPVDGVWEPIEQFSPDERYGSATK